MSDPDTDKSNEAKVLLTHYDTAFNSTLEDLDLDSTSTQVVLELVDTDPTDLWKYAYKYPVDCAFLRRLQTDLTKDDRYTHIKKRIAIHEGQKVIFTNEQDAIAEYISKSVPLSSLSANVGLAIAYKLAFLSAPLIVGKGANKLRQDIMTTYLVYKGEAQEQDKRESFSYEPEWIDSEFVRARME